MNLRSLSTLPTWDWPDDAADVIESALTDRRAAREDRMLAAVLASELIVGDDDLADSLLNIAGKGDEPQDLRAASAAALGPMLEYAESRDPVDEEPGLSDAAAERVQARLRELYESAGTPAPVRRAALAASARAAEDWHHDAVRSAWAGGDPAWRLTAVECMSSVAGFGDEILQALGGDDPDLRFWAVRAAGNWEVDAAWPQVVGLLRSKTTDRETLMAALEAAAEIRPHEAPEVLGPLADSSDEQIAMAAMDALDLAGALLAEGEEDEGVDWDDDGDEEVEMRDDYEESVLGDDDLDDDDDLGDDDEDDLDDLDDEEFEDDDDWEDDGDDVKDADEDDETY
ncbi:MAG: hypothetical protein R6X25_04405 [Candidatus Krumholzibacteriia bacterium]